MEIQIYLFVLSIHLICLFTVEVMSASSNVYHGWRNNMTAKKLLSYKRPAIHISVP